MDTSELDQLTDLLTEHSAAVLPMARALVEVNTELVEAQARSNAEQVRDTGELADSVESDVRGLTGQVTADPRQGWFQETGSPNTGAPNPWLTLPAERAQDALIAALGRQVALW